MLRIFSPKRPKIQKKKINKYLEKYTKASLFGPIANLAILTGTRPPYKGWVILFYEAHNP